MAGGSHGRCSRPLAPALTVPNVKVYRPLPPVQPLQLWKTTLEGSRVVITVLLAYVLPLFVYLSV